MSPPSQTRCFFFDDDGYPAYGGCKKKGYCLFVHPSHSSWDTAVKSTRTPWESNSAGPSHRHERYNDRRETEDVRRQRHRSRSPRRRRSPEHSRRVSYSEKAHEHERERAREHRARDAPESRERHTRTHSQSSIASSVATPAPPPTGPPLTSSKSVLPAQSIGENLKPHVVAKDATSAGSTRAPPFSGNVPATSGQISTVMPPPTPSGPPRSTSMAPPPPPSSAPPMMSPQPSLPPQSLPPPQPLPPVPAGLRMEVPPAPPPELSEIEKGTIWEGRVRLFAESAKAYELCQTLEQEYQAALATTQSNFFASLRPEGRARLTAQLTALRQKCDEAKHAYERLQIKILGSASWPAAPPQVMPEDRVRHFELVRYVNELNSNVETMRKLLGEISHKPPPEPLFLDGDSDDNDDMDVDGPVAGPSKKISLPSRKRQRVDDSVDDVRVGPEDMPTQQQIEDTREQLRQFEEQLAALRNEQDMYQQDLKAGFLYTMDTRVQEIEEARLKKQRARDAAQREREADTQALISAAQNKAASADNDISELSTEVSNMLLHVDALTAKVEEETRKRDESYKRLLEVEERMKGYTATQQVNATAIEALKSAVKAYTTRPPSPPVTPVPISPALLLESFQEPLIQTLRNEMKPLVEEVRTNVEKLVMEKNSLLFASTWTKIGQTLGVLKKVQESIERGQNQGQAVH